MYTIELHGAFGLEHLPGMSSYELKSRLLRGDYIADCSLGECSRGYWGGYLEFRP